MHILLGCILILMGIIVIPKIFAKDKSEIWSPLVFWILYFAYYVVLPCFGDMNLFGIDWSVFSSEYCFAAFLSLLFIYFGFHIQISKFRFYHFATEFDNSDNFKVGICLALIAIISYTIFNGFNLSLFADDNFKRDAFDAGASYNNPAEYITNLISLLCLSSALLLSTRKLGIKNKVVFCTFFLVAMILYTIIGYRYRLLILCITVVTTYFLYPCPKRINWLVMLPLAFILYISMGIIEKSRNYGNGLNFENISNMNVLETKAHEGDIVAGFSAACISKYSVNDYNYFEPIFTAVCMPIPRAVFPDKPDGYYLRDANLKVFGKIEYGAAYTMFTEAYISFGWIGIIIQGLFIGFLSRCFWETYRRNRYSIGAIILLALYNGFAFVWFSRGYMAQDFVTFMYFIIIPFWVAKPLCKKIKLPVIKSIVTR